MSAKERVVVLDRAAHAAAIDFPLPAFDCNWSEYPDTPAADLVPRVFWATTIITHDCGLDAAALAQLHKLKRVLVTGGAAVDEAACAAQGVDVMRMPGASPAELVARLDTAVQVTLPQVHK